MLNFDALDSVNFTSQVNNMIENNILTREDVLEVDLVKLENAVLSFKDRVKGKKLYREQNFISMLKSDNVFNKANEGVLVQGIIDLLAIGEDGAEIIDYKYSSLKGENLKARYSKQLDLYALAVENSLKIKVNKKTLVNVLSGECIDF
jgi:ATP-dependent exoDNAse (exonuclease V) beta subunit